MYWIKWYIGLFQKYRCSFDSQISVHWQFPHMHFLLPGATVLSIIRFKNSSQEISAFSFGPQPDNTFGETFTITLSFKKVEHIPWCALNSIRYFFVATSCPFVKGKATAIFIKSGIINGITHQPKMVDKPMAPVLCMYISVRLRYWSLLY